MKRISALFLAAAGVFAGCAVGMIFAREDPDTSRSNEISAKQSKQGDDSNRAADREAIRKSADEFAKAFAKGDAKAVAAQWTVMGEVHEATGEVIVGRAEIEKAFAEQFKDAPKGSIEVDIRSIRFPSRDTAVEDGFLRYTPREAGLPSSTVYTAWHVREDGHWRLAYSREWGAGQDRLGDLAFLVGTWQGGPKGNEMKVIFAKDGDSQFISGKFSKKVEGKFVSAGSIRIGFDPQRGQIRSWHFDNDGGHGESLWLRDGDHWVLDAIGLLSDGTETAAVNLLGRLNNNELTWRSIDRVVGENALPDTMPIRLAHVREKK